jgi:hypothetical protein
MNRTASTNTLPTVIPAHLKNFATLPAMTGVQIYRAEYNTIISGVGRSMRALGHSAKGRP